MVVGCAIVLLLFCVLAVVAAFSFYAVLGMIVAAAAGGFTFAILRHRGVAREVCIAAAVAVAAVAVLASLAVIDHRSARSSASGIHAPSL